MIALRSLETRYFIFIIPAISAGAFSLGRNLIDRIGGINGRKKIMTSIAFGVVLFSTAIVDGGYLIRFIKSEPVEVIEAAALLKKIAGGHEHIIARKPHIGFYTGLVDDGIPLGQSEHELYQFLCSERPQEAFLFFGQEEAGRRPELRSLQTPKSAPDWLLPVGHGEPVGSSWVLYKINCSGH